MSKVNGTGRKSSENKLSLEALLKNFKEKAVKNYKERKKDKDKENPINVPISLWGTVDFGYKEIVYTKTLGYLFDANGTHGFGRAIFDKFCQELKLPEIKTYNVITEACENNKDEENKNRYDVCITGKRANGSDLIIVIEAKIGSPVDSEQLKKYSQELMKKHGKAKIIKIFLTQDPFEQDEATKDWESITWEDIANILWSAVRKKESKIGYNYVRYFISSIYQEIYENTNVYYYPYSYDVSLVNKISKQTITEKEFLKYPATLTEIYYINYEINKNCEFCKSYEKLCKECSDFLVKTIKETTQTPRKNNFKTLAGMWKDSYRGGDSRCFVLRIKYEMDMNKTFDEKLYFIISGWGSSVLETQNFKNDLKEMTFLESPKSWNKEFFVYKKEITDLALKLDKIEEDIIKNLEDAIGNKSKKK